MLSPTVLLMRTLYVSVLKELFVARLSMPPPCIASNQAVALLTTGARQSAMRNIKSVAECLADELINAAKGSSNSYAIKVGVMLY